MHFMPANALWMQLRSGGYVIRDLWDSSLIERAKQGAQHRLAFEIRFCERPCAPTQFKPHWLVIRKPANGTSKCSAILRCNYEAALGHDLTDFRIRTASRYHGTAAGEHPGQL